MNSFFASRERTVDPACRPSPARDPFGWKPSGRRRRIQRPSEHVAKRRGRPAAKALYVARLNVERPRREARLDAHDGVDGPRRQTRLRQSGAQLLFRDDTEREWPTGDFGDEARAFRTR